MADFGTFAEFQELREALAREREAHKIAQGQLRREREARERAERALAEERREKERLVHGDHLRRQSLDAMQARAEKAEGERDKLDTTCEAHCFVIKDLERDLADAVGALRKLIRDAEHIGIDPDGFTVWLPEPMNGAVAEVRSLLDRLDQNNYRPNLNNELIQAAAQLEGAVRWTWNKGDYPAKLAVALEKLRATLEKYEETKSQTEAKDAKS